MPHVKQRTGMIIARDETNREAWRRTARRSSGADRAARSGDAEGKRAGQTCRRRRRACLWKKKPGRAPRSRRDALPARCTRLGRSARQRPPTVLVVASLRARAVRPSSGWNGAARGRASPGTGGSASAAPGPDARARLRVSASRRARPADCEIAPARAPARGAPRGRRASGARRRRAVPRGPRRPSRVPPRAARGRRRALGRASRPRARGVSPRRRARRQARRRRPRAPRRRRAVRVLLAAALRAVASSPRPGSASAAMDTPASSASRDARERAARKQAAVDLAAYYCQEGQDRRAAEILTREGYRYRLAPAVMRWRDHRTLSTNDGGEDETAAAASSGTPRRFLEGVDSEKRGNSGQPTRRRFRAGV